MIVPESRNWADHLDIVLDRAPLASRKSQKFKLCNMLSLAYKIQLLFIMGLSLESIITNFTSIALFFHLLPTSNKTCQCSPKL